MSKVEPTTASPIAVRAPDEAEPSTDGVESIPAAPRAAPEHRAPDPNSARVVNAPMSGPPNLGGLSAPGGRGSMPRRAGPAGSSGESPAPGITSVPRTDAATATTRTRAAEAVAPTQEVPATQDVQSIPETRAATKTTWDKIFDAIGVFFNEVATGLAMIVDAVFDGASLLVSGLLFVLAAPALIFGVSPADLWEGIRKGVRPVFETLSGIAQGAVMLPFNAAMVGCTFVKNFFGFRWVTDGAHAIEMLTQPIVGAFMVGVGPLFHGIKGLSDALNEPRPLNDEEKEAMRGYYPNDVIERARIVTGPSVITKLFMPGMAGAFTIGDTIYLSPNDDDIGNSTLRHEAVHSLQYREQGGVVPFLSTYYARFFGNFMTNGFDFDRAYEDIPAEEEAYRLT